MTPPCRIAFLPYLGSTLLQSCVDALARTRIRAGQTRNPAIRTARLSTALASALAGWLLLSIPAAAAVESIAVASGDGEFLVNSLVSSGADADVAADANGAFVVAWQSTPDTPAAFTQIAARRYAASGSPLADEFRVDTLGGGSFAPTMAVAAAGAFAVAWWHFDGFQIRGRRHNAAGATVGVEFIATNPPFVGLTQIGNPAIAPIFLDQMVVVWEGTSDLLRYDIAGRRIDSAGLPIGNGFLANAAFTADHTRAAVTADAAGNYIVAWNVGSTVQGRKFTSAGVFGPPFDIATTTLGPVALAADGPGNFVVVWGQGGMVMARRYGSDTAPLGPAFRIDVSGSAFLPDVASYGDGRFVVAWQKSIIGIVDVDVLARQFDAAGQPTSAELPVNTITAGSQSRPALATGAGNDFVVVWTSQAPSSNETDIHGRVMGAVATIFANGFE